MDKPALTSSTRRDASTLVDARQKRPGAGAGELRKSMVSNDGGNSRRQVGQDDILHEKEMVLHVRFLLKWFDRNE